MKRIADNEINSILTWECPRCKRSFKEQWGIRIAEYEAEDTRLGIEIECPWCKDNNDELLILTEIEDRSIKKVNCWLCEGKLFEKDKVRVEEDFEDGYGKRLWAVHKKCFRQYERKHNRIPNSVEMIRQMGKK